MITPNQLDGYLSVRYPNIYISGKKDSNILMWGIKDSSNAVVPKILTFVIGEEYDPLTSYSTLAADVKDGTATNYDAFDKLYAFAKSISKSSSIPLILIVYPKIEKYKEQWHNSIKEYPLEDVHFSVISFNNETVVSKNVTGVELRTVLYGLLGVTFTDKGTKKAENRDISDYFHLWSRTMLSPQLVKADIDGCIQNSMGEYVLIEFKRSNIPPIPQWRPIYDKPDYELEFKFSRLLNAKFWLLHHEDKAIDDSTVISFYDIKGIKENTPPKTEFLLCNEIVLELPLMGDNSLDERINGKPIGYCPKCGSKVRNGMYGYYCSGNCGMKIGKLYGVQLDANQVQALLHGQKVQYNSVKGEVYTALPEIEFTSYNGFSFYRWKSRLGAM